MTMTNRKAVLATLLAALAAAPLAVTPLTAQAQYRAPAAPQFAHAYTQAELDQMLAPIALYPDALLSQVLMAATYPIEVVEAARWSRANPGLRGDDAVRLVQDEDWDPSVKSLVAFPEILLRMDEKLEWTRALGDAFLAQEPQMMDQVQRLRQRAAANGNLRSDEQIRVEHEGPVIVLRPAHPEYVYVPYYDPMVVYGNWWWPDYRPVYWDPWPGYARPRASHAFWWGRPSGISLNFFFGDFDWGRRHVRVARHSYYYRQPAYYNRGYTGDRTRWNHDPHHRRAVDYRNAEVFRRFNAVQPGGREAVRAQRGDGRQFDRREDRRVDRQAAPAAAPADVQRRMDTRQQPAPERENDIQRKIREIRGEAPHAPEVRAQQRQARQQAQDGQRQAQQQARQEQRAAIPAAQAPQQQRRIETPQPPAPEQENDLQRKIRQIRGEAR